MDRSGVTGMTTEKEESKSGGGGKGTSIGSMGRGGGRSGHQREKSVYSLDGLARRIIDLEMALPEIRKMKNSMPNQG